MTLKTLTLEKNFNNKAENDIFIHIAPVPERAVTSADLEKSIFRMSFADGSHAPVKVKVREINVKKIGQITPLESLLSHGMTTSELIDFYYLRKKLANPNPESELAVYWYEKVRAEA